MKSSLKIMKMLSVLTMILLVMFLASCGGVGGDGEEYYEVTVSWDTNVESLVNSSGGGYKVYYSENSGFSIDDSDVKDVPYVSGDLSPTSTTLKLTEGNWYIKVVAYFSLSGGSTSLPSQQISITLP